MSGSSHVVVGAGLIGRRVAQRLVERGDRVTLVTRRGTELHGARSVAADASDAAALTAASDHVSTLFLCANPAVYSAEEWAKVWPPIFRAAIAAAHEAAAGLVVMGNLYPYGQSDGPMTEHSPELTTSPKGLIRKSGWELVKAAHDAGELHAVEVRASDYFGPGAGQTAMLGERFFVPVLESRTARVVGDPAQPHSWSYLDDIAATLVAAADYRGDWGRVWHVPSGAPHSELEIAETVNEWFGTHGKVAPIPELALRTLALFSPQLKGVLDESYQFTHPFVLDSSETERMLGVHATPWETALRDTAQSYRKLF
ncbi:NAD-dependent epimerase/dehydratase family protein [Gryllotalpicola daejeonensis]|uniref:NAD-dependent epimerase/dehydratase family protein n=1 Tax=Gryllotalpicola daejeonensis TaxID=993087 RepID=A0ABP7ZMP5_9MICO